MLQQSSRSNSNSNSGSLGSESFRETAPFSSHPAEVWLETAVHYPPPSSSSEVASSWLQSEDTGCLEESPKTIPVLDVWLTKAFSTSRMLICTCGHPTAEELQV